jgi:hypothetical protein
VAEADQITISGTVTGPSGGPVEGVGVFASLATGEFAHTSTDSSGSYLLSLPAGLVFMHVRAPESMRLAERFVSLGDVSADVVRDFQLEAGHLVTGTVLTPHGQPAGDGFSVELHSMSTSLSTGEWFNANTTEVDGEFRVVAPVGEYWIQARSSPPHYDVQQHLDLSAGDVTGLVLRLSSDPTSTIHTDPPVAALIDIGDPDELGIAQVVGSVGAVLPSAHVLLVNLNSTHTVNTVSDEDGSFSMQIFAPPGSFVIVRHGSPGVRWAGFGSGSGQWQTPYPATILYVPHEHAGDPGTIPFADAGAILGTTADTVGAAWAIEASIGTEEKAAPKGRARRSGSANAAYQASDALRISGTIRILSPAIDSNTDVSGVSALGDLSMLRLFDQDGRAISPHSDFMSSSLTPTGFPILGRARPALGAGAEIPVSGLQRVGDHVIEGSIDTTFQIPAEAPPGVYRPVIYWFIDGVPSTNQWPGTEVITSTFEASEAVLPPLVVGEVAESWRIPWRLLAEDFSLGQRGTGAMEDRGRFELAPKIVSQGAPYVIPPVNVRAGTRISYRLEPFLPTISYNERRQPCRPLLPFADPAGVLNVVVEEPDGSIQDLGSAPLVQSFAHSSTTDAGADINIGTVRLDDVYSLTTLDHRFRFSFEKYGRHFVHMSGELEDLWGNSYSGGGSYELWVGYPIDIDPGVLPGTPMAVGDVFNPSVQLNPRVPAEIELTVTLLPDSDPAQVLTQTISGAANAHGYFDGADGEIELSAAGEYRVDLAARYVTDTGELYMGAMTWGGVVMSPPAEAELVAHGQRGLDTLSQIPASWFVSSRDLQIPAGAVSHTFNPYFNGDLLWSRMSDGAWGGDSLLIVATVQDTVGDLETSIRSRAERMNLLAVPHVTEERFDSGELPLFSSTRSGRAPNIDSDLDQIAYSYRYSERPGVRVREVVSEDPNNGGYWRLDTLYDDQLGVGVGGDQPNDFKFQYLGVVFRDLDADHNEYLGQGTGWVFIPESDTAGTRTMPPFAGPGNGGWTTEGGPIMTLEGKDVHIFVVPTGVRPGAVLEVGDAFRFGGHIMPTLPSQVAVTVDSPTGAEHELTGQANEVGYFFSDDSFAVDEPGVWTVDDNVWHDGACSGGSTVSPYPAGGVLGSDDGVYRFYVPTPDQPPLEISSPVPGFLVFADEVYPVNIRARVPSGLENATLHYTITMPGVVLDQGKVKAKGRRVELVFDAETLHDSFPNLDLWGRELPGRPGLSDTISIGLLLEGTLDGGQVYRAATVTLQGEEVSVGSRLPRLPGPPRRVMRRLP